MLAEQRVKFINIAKHLANNAKYKAQVLDNPGSQNRQLALEELIKTQYSLNGRGSWICINDMLLTRISNGRLMRVLLDC